jgi:uncharacterized membrane protein YqiK
VKVQDAEITRRERELIATVLKQAEVERQRIETLASAERQRLITEAEGRASAIRAQGEAEAEIIFKKGEAEAKAMNVKAEAFQEYNQAAVLDKLITGLPEVVRALSEPLSKVDKVTIVSTGNGDAAGAYKLTGDITCALRSALRHADVGTAQQSTPNWRQSAKAGTAAAGAGKEGLMTSSVPVGFHGSTGTLRGFGERQ